MKFLKYLFFISLGAVLLLISFVFALGFFASSIIDNAKQALASNSVLEISLNQRIKDFVPDNIAQINQILDAENQAMGLNRILKAIEKASSDPKIAGISLQTNELDAGLATLKSIRDQLKRFKNSGKFIYAYANFYDQKSYYLNSVADSIFVNPMGKVDFKGIHAEFLYFKELQEKSGVNVEVVKHGEFKSAVEPFLNNEMSEASRTQFSEFFSSIWSEMLKDMSESRSIAEKRMNQIAENLWGRNANLAKKHQLVDDLIYFDSYEKKLAVASGAEKNDYKKIQLKNYLKTFSTNNANSITNKIAVIYAQGDIIYGKGDEENVGQELMIKALKNARKNPNTKAIVLRINSPGGSALASELILQELKITSAELPIVVSMGDYAASGGYYISCAADAIFAQPTTTTGSIGVFGLLLNLHEIAQRVGVNSNEVSTHNSAKYSTFKPMSNRYKSIVQEDIERVYDIFIKHVAENRKMTTEEVNKLAEGRVWSGLQAKKNGLIDQLGNLNEAIKHAAALASINEYEVWDLPNYKLELKDRIANALLSEVKHDFSINSEYLKLIQKLNSLKNQQDIQARLPFLFRFD